MGFVTFASGCWNRIINMFCWSSADFGRTFYLSSLFYLSAENLRNLKRAKMTQKDFNSKPGRSREFPILRRLSPSS